MGKKTTTKEHMKNALEKVTGLIGRLAQAADADVAQVEAALSSHTGDKNNPHGVTAAKIGAAAASHGTHVSYSTAAPKMDGTASVGTASTVARSDHVHPTDTSRAPASHSHNYAGSSSAGGTANSAVKLSTARTISLTGDVTGSTSFDGSANKSISAALASSGVAAGIYGSNAALEDTLIWIPNNRGRHSSSATLTLTAKKTGTITFTYDVSSESNYDKFTCTVNGTALVNAVSGTVGPTAVTSAAFAVGNTIVFTYAKDSSADSGRDRARVYNLKFKEGSAAAVEITAQNLDAYFTVSEGDYTFVACQAVCIPAVTVDAKGRATKAEDMVIGVRSRPLTGSAAIPTSGWSSDSTATYPKYYDIAVTGVTASDRASVDIAPASMSAAVTCGLCPVTETLAGKIRIRAASVPTAALTANYFVEKGA